MLKMGTSTCPTFRLVLFLTLTAIYVTGCGLGLDAEVRLERMQQSYQDGDYRAAAIDAKNVLLEQPDNIAARLVLGHASVRLGDGASAERDLRIAVELGAALDLVIVDLGRSLLMQQKYEQVIAEITPELSTADADRLQLIRMRGDALLGMRQPIAARESYMQALAVDGDNSAAHLGVVNSFIAEQNYPNARATLDSLLSNDDDYVPGWLTSASLSMLVRNADRASSDYERASVLAKKEFDDVREMQALSGLVSAVLVQGNVDDAKFALERMIELAPQDTRTLLASARLAVAVREWTKAQAYLQEILRRVRDHRPAQLLLGVVHKESGNLAQAEMYLSTVVAAAPGDSNARRLLAETRLELDKADEARKALAPVVSSPYADTISLVVAARANLSLGKFDDAAVLLQRIVDVEPQNTDLQIQLAFTHLRSGNVEKALMVLESIPVSQGHNEFERASLLILTQMANGKKVAALDSARTLRDRWPKRANVHLLLGLIEVSAGDYAAAKISFSASNRLVPDDIRAIRYLAQLDELKGDPRSARVKYLSILKLQPDDVLTMVALARLAAQGESFGEVRNWLEKARAADSSIVSPRAALGSLYLAINEFSAAEEVIREAIKLDQSNAKLHNLLGLAQNSQDNRQGAMSSFERAMTLDPAEPSYRLNLARAQAEKGDVSSARLTLRESTDWSLRDMPSAVMLASLQADSGNLDGAKNIARQLRRMYPDEAIPHALEAELLAGDGETLRAAAAYDRALKIQNSQGYAVRSYQIRVQAGLDNSVEPLISYVRERPADINMKMYLAQAYQSMDERSNASVQYEQVLAIDPDNVVAANNLAWIYFETGDPRAEEVARRAYASQPENGAVVDTLAWILVKKGKLQDGIVLLRNAIELDGDSLEVHFHLAVALLAAGNAEEAKSVLQEILEKEDGFASRQEARVMLRKL